MNRKSYFKITGRPGMFHFVLVAPNHEVISVSENYKSQAMAQKGIVSVQKNSQDPKNFERRYSEGTISQPYFVLKAANGEIILTSEMYSTAAARDKGIRSVVMYGDTTEIIVRNFVNFNQWLDEVKDLAIKKDIYGESDSSKDPVKLSEVDIRELFTKDNMEPYFKLGMCPKDSLEDELQLWADNQ